MGPSAASELDAVELRFEGGTVAITAPSSTLPPCLAAPSADDAAPLELLWDARTACHRAPADHYRPIVERLRRAGIPYTDEVRAYDDLELSPRGFRKPFTHQREAIEAWLQAKSRGVVVLPTGSGKTQVAMMALVARPRSALFVVPTLDLLNQWYDELTAAFERPIGIVGGGYHDPQDITVITYDSAHLTMDRLGNRFGLVVFDECHHLPSPAYRAAARMCVAPFRLGLTATPDREDGAGYDDIVGPICYRRDITDLSGHILAPYETERLEVPLTDEERQDYEEARGLYLNFVRYHRIPMSEPGGWGMFLQRSSQSAEGRRAFEAYRRQRTLAIAAKSKLAVLERLLHRHRRDRTLIFTEDNATVYRIAKAFLVAPITHQTPIKERSHYLASFNQGELRAIVTSKVLNEGVNVPAANIAVVLSGSGSVREHVQRLGRILRRDENKRAKLYELVARGTAEQWTSEKRRRHVAYE